MISVDKGGAVLYSNYLVHLQDFPNVWPPHAYIVLQAYKNLPQSISIGNFTTFVEKAADFSFLPPGHFGLDEASLPKQPKFDGSGPVAPGLAFGTSGNVGNLDKYKTKSWHEGMAETIANRFIASAFCSWYATGGSVAGVIPQVSSSVSRPASSSDCRLINSVGLKLIQKLPCLRYLAIRRGT